MMHSPLRIKLALMFYTGGRVSDWFSDISWESSACREELEWMKDEGIIFAWRDDSNAGAITDKGRAWVEYICSTPLPEQVWRLPVRSETLKPPSEIHPDPSGLAVRTWQEVSGT